MQLRMTVVDAATRLRQLNNEVGNLHNRVFGGGGEPQVYVNGLHELEDQLRNVFGAAEIFQQLYTDHYFYLLSATSGPRANMILNTEIARLRRILTDLATQLEMLLPLAERPGHIVLPDTNGLLQCETFDSLNWTEEVDEKAVRLVLLMPVIREVDGKKSAGKNVGLAERAVTVQKAIFRYLPQIQQQGFAQLRPGVTLEIFRDVPGSTRNHVSVDETILEQAAFLRQLVGADRVGVATRDIGMHISAHDHGIKAHWISEKNWLPRAPKPVVSTQDTAQPPEQPRVADAALA